MAKLIEITGKALSGEWGTDDETGCGIPVLRTTNFTNEGIVNYRNVVTRTITKKKIVADMIAADSSLAKMKMTMAAKPFKPREFKVTKAASLDYEVGDTVRHIKFGVGIVKDIVDGGRDYEVTVDFDKVGVKKMFAGFAKLKKL